MIVHRTDSSDPNFKYLVKLLDEDLKIRDGSDHSFYSQFNSIDHIKNVIVIEMDGQPVACGAMRNFDGNTIEIKRMYTEVNSRGRGLATLVLGELEAWALELGMHRCVLETGKRQPEAIKLYQKMGYKTIANYVPYIGVDNSLCFEKMLR